MDKLKLVENVLYCLSIPLFVISFYQMFTYQDASKLTGGAGLIVLLGTSALSLRTSCVTRRRTDI